MRRAMLVVAVLIAGCAIVARHAPEPPKPSRCTLRSFEPGEAWHETEPCEPYRFYCECVEDV